MNRKSVQSPKIRTSNSAFTVLEVLFSCAILIILIILLVGIADGTTRMWIDGQRWRGTVQEASTGMAVITKDLHSAVLTTNPASLVIEKESEEGAGNRLFLLVNSRDKGEPDNGGDLGATGYFVARDPTDGTQNLYRFHSTGKEVETAYEHGLLKELYATASSSNTPNTELLVHHVIRFDVRHIPDTSCVSSAGLLKISLSRIGGETSMMLITEPRTTSDRATNERLLREHLHRYTTFVALPPERDLQPGL